MAIPKTAPRTIVLKERGIRKELIAGGAITPGHLIAVNSAGKFVVHPTAGGVAGRMFAVEQDHNGKGIDDAYASNDLVMGEIVSAGSEINALIAAGAAAIAVGDYLESAGDGTFRKVVGLTDSSGGTANTTVQAIGGTFSQSEIANNFADVAAQINAVKGGAIAVALEAVDNSAGGSAVRLKVLVI